MLLHVYTVLLLRRVLIVGCLYGCLEGSIQNEYFNYPLYQLHFGGNFNSFNGSRFGYIYICDNTNEVASLNLSRDTFVILSDDVYPRALPYENHLRSLQRKEHVKAMIFFSVGTGQGETAFLNDGTRSMDVWMSAFEMNPKDLLEVIRFYRNESYADVGVSVEGVDSEWYLCISSSSALVMQVILIVMSVICILYDVFLLIFKLRTFSRINLSLICLSLDLCSSIMKLLWKCSAWGRTHLYIWWLHWALYSWWIPFQIASLVMVFFYWNKRLKKSNCAVLSIERKYKNVTSCILIFLFIMELISSFTRVFLPYDVFFDINQALYALSSVIIVIYGFVTKYSIWKFLTKESNVITFKPTLKKMSMILNFLCILITTIIVLQAIRLSLITLPLVAIITWSGIFICSDFLSLSVAYTFHPQIGKSISE